MLKQWYPLLLEHGSRREDDLLSHAVRRQRHPDVDIKVSFCSRFTSCAMGGYCILLIDAGSPWDSLTHGVARYFQSACILFVHLHTVSGTGTGAGAERYSAGECWKLKVIQESCAAAKPRLLKIFGGSGNESWPSFQTSPSPLTGNGNTVKANNGLQPSGRHNKANHPYTRMVPVHVFSRFLSGSYPGLCQYAVWSLILFP